MASKDEAAAFIVAELDRREEAYAESLRRQSGDVDELLRRQRRFRAVAHLRGRRKRSAFATWALAASLASFDRESRRVLRRRLLADAWSMLRTVRTGPCTPRSASRMAAYSTV